MIAKVAVFFAVLAAVHATGLVSHGAPLLAGNHLRTVSAQSTAINHIAPVASIAYSGAVGYGHEHGIAGAPLGIAGVGVAPLGLGHGLAAGNVLVDGLAGGHLGTVSAQSTAINHIAPVASLAYGGAAGIGHGIAGVGVSPLGLRTGLAAGNLPADGLVGHGIVGSRYGGVIGHNVVGHGLVAGVRYGGHLGLGLNKAIL